MDEINLIVISPEPDPCPLPRIMPLGSSGHTIHTDVSLTSGNTSLTGGPGAEGEKIKDPRTVPLGMSHGYMAGRS